MFFKPTYLPLCVVLITSAVFSVPVGAGAAPPFDPMRDLNIYSQKKQEPEKQDSFVPEAENASPAPAPAKDETPPSSPPPADPETVFEPRIEETKPAPVYKAAPLPNISVSEPAPERQKAPPVSDPWPVLSAEDETTQEDISVLTVSKVLRHVYATHPALQAAEAGVLSTTENIAQALSNYRPYADISASASVQKTKPATFGAPSSSQQSMGLNLSQPLYRGGRTTAAVKAADHRIQAERAEFDSTVQSLFLDVVTAYLNVLRDQEILALRSNNETVLTTQMEAAEARFDLGDVTLTDVSQARSRLSAATAERVAASGALRTSQALFERVTGLPPAGLLSPDNIYMKTEGLDTLIARALDGHPDLRASQAFEAVAQSEGREVLGELLPELSLQGSMVRNYNPTFGEVDYTDNSQLTLQATIPLYPGGAVRSQYRQAQYQALQQDFHTRDLERNIRQYVIESWENLQAARAGIAARQAQIEAS
ncbi:MAG: TolC family protein, partial [Pseudomonadota bacterium]